MIVTVTLNPALDKTIKVPEFQPGDLNRVAEVRKDPGGKGINVSRAVANLGGETLALGFLGGPSGQFIAASLEEAGISHDFTWGGGITRTNVKVVDPEVNQETEINEPGPKVSDSKLEELIKTVVQTTSPEDYVVLTGSLPPGVPDDIYAKLITKLQAQNSRAVLDASGLPLQEGVKAQPYLVKPNRKELEVLVDRELTTIEEIIAAGQELRRQGVEVVVVSLGAKGAVLISKPGIWRTTPPTVEVASTVGAGDTLVGALALQFSQGQEFPQALSYATAASASSVARPGTQLGQAAEIDALLSKVTRSELERKGGRQ